MDFLALYEFFFESYEGIGTLVVIGLVLTLFASFIWERKNRKRFKSREKSEDDWSFFDDDDDESEEESQEPTSKSKEK